MFLEDVFTVLTDGEARAKAILADGRYTEAAKAQQAAAERQAAKIAAVDLARRGLVGLKERREGARRAYSDAQLALLAAQDTARLVLMAERARSYADDPARLLVLAQQALDLANHDDLIGARDFVLPQLRRLVGRPVGDGFSRPTLEAGDVHDLDRRVADALAGAEPEGLRAARADLAAIEAEARETVLQIRRLNSLTADLGGRPPLAELEDGPTAVLAGSLETGRLTIGRQPGLLAELAGGV